MKHIEHTKTASIAQNRNWRTVHKILMLLRNANPHDLDQCVGELVGECDIETVYDLAKNADLLAQQMVFLDSYLTNRATREDHETATKIANMKVKDVRKAIGYVD